MKQKSTFEYQRIIKLPPAIGDWTTIQYDGPEQEEIQISPVYNINFDSLPKQTLAYVHYLHYRIGETLVEKLTSDLDLKIELHSVSASQMSYDDFLRSQLDPVYQSDFNLSGIGRFSMILEWQLADILINRLTGGRGEVAGLHSINDMEKAILGAQVQEFVPILSQSWKGIFKADDVQLNSYCGDFIKDRQTLLREAYIVFTFNIGFGKGDLRRIRLAYPSHVLKRLLYLKKGQKDPVKQRILLNKKTLHQHKVDVKAVLGRAKLTMHDLYNLQVGDVIALDTPLDTPIEVDISRDTKLYAQPGNYHNKLCVQIIFWDGNDSVAHFVTKEAEQSQDSTDSLGSSFVSHQETQPAAYQQEQGFLPASVPLVTEENNDEENAHYEDTSDEPQDNYYEDQVYENEPEENYLDDEQEALDSSSDTVDDSGLDDDEFLNVRTNSQEESNALETEEDDFSWDDLDDF